MQWIDRLRRRLSLIVRRKALDQDLEAELEFFIEQRTERNKAAGMSPDEARRVALASAGSITAVKEDCRDARGFRWIEDVFQDAHHGLRSLRKHPAFAVVAILTLALGVGANTAIFSFLDNVLLKPLPYPEADRIVRVLQKLPSGAPFPIRTEDFLDWQHRQSVFDFIAAQRPWNASLTGQETPLLLHGIRVSPSYYDVPRIKPLLGRTFLPEEAEYGHDHVVILSYEIWATRFGADPSVIGRTIRLDGEPYTVIGVMPGGSVFDRMASFQIAKPLAFTPAERAAEIHWLTAVARLKRDVTLGQAQKQMDGLAAELAKEHPATNSGMGIKIDQISDILVGSDLRTSFYVLFGAAGLVLIVGCANLANLSLARGMSRSKEVAVRASLGGGRGRLVRQFLTENVLVSVMGGAVGVGFGYLVMAFLRREIPSAWLPAEADVQIDGRVFAFAVVISLVTGLVFGLAPAVHLTNPDLAQAMKEGGRGTSSGISRRRFRSGLVILEVALAFMLLTGAGLLMRSFLALRDVSLGFDTTNVVTAGLSTPLEQYSNVRKLDNYLLDLRTAVKRIPGVLEVAFAASVPLRGASMALPMQLVGTEPIERPRRPLYFFKIVSAEYFKVFDIPIKRGRAFDEHDAKGTPLVVVMNERLVRRLFPDRDPIGKQILIPQPIGGRVYVGDDMPYEIVGVVGNEKMQGLIDDRTEGFYASMDQHSLYNPNLAVRSAIDPQALQGEIRNAIDSINKDQVISDFKTMEQIKSESLFDSRFRTTLLGVFSLVALLLAAVGTYSVISYSVAERTHEIGLRAALGANAANLRWMVLGQGFLLAIAGLVIGAAGSFILARTLATLLYGVGSHDPLTFAAAAGTVLAASLAACLVPAWRATRVDPLVALRYE
jgi:putative ABC transport system permease protein